MDMMATTFDIAAPSHRRRSATALC
jgi:hypothetical protein